MEGCFERNGDSTTLKNDYFFTVLLPLRKSTKRSSQSDPSTRVMILPFPAHIPEYPHKTIPAITGPGNFDWLTRLSPVGDIGDEITGVI
ncbi:hypothetical protein [Prolixibacter bellariivorans]|uniref:hypothetical protein n=1 Tax=Prolixibacter bellariivorans TaxID=314319 RepID=UPI00046F1430|nr:hypothetical protein [Prolixibacter bellariivorans]